jgi:DNA-binding IclR family transcriptional regulator
MSNIALSDRSEAATRPVPAVERAVRLMDTLASSRRPMALAELARELELPKSSTHGLLATLVGLDLARRDAEGHFSLGPRALQWASAYSLQSDVTAAFLEQTRHPGPLASETVMLAVLDGSEVVYLACRQGSRPLAVNFRVGGRLPATCTATGKAMLATLGAPSLETLIEAPLARLTRHSISDRTTLLRRLRTVQRQGYAVDDEETAEGMQCFGAPVFCAGEGRAIAAVAVSLIKAGLTARRRESMIEAIRLLAGHLSHRLGALQAGKHPTP